MLQSNKSQGSSITIIVAVVIGLIIIIVVIMMLTGKLGAFGKGLGEQEKFGKECEELKNDKGSATAVLRANGEDCKSWEVELISSDSIATGRKCCVAK